MINDSDTQLHLSPKLSWCAIFLKFLRETVSSTSGALSCYIERGWSPKTTCQAQLLSVCSQFLSLANCSDHSAHGSALEDPDPTAIFSSVHSASFSECPAQCHRQSTEQRLYLMVSILRKSKRSRRLQQAFLPLKTKARESTIRLAHCCYLLLPFPVIFLN